MKKIIVICLFSSLAMSLFGQAGVNLKGGVGTLVTNDGNFTRSGGAHYGYRAAAFARIGASDTWYFNPGLSYEAYNLMTSEDFNAFDADPKLHFVKGYINIAFFLIRTKAFKMRLSGGGNINYLAALDDNDQNIKLEKFNDATLGLNGLIGLDFWFITLDLGYEHNLTDFFHEVDGSKSRFWTVSAGFFF